MRNRTTFVQSRWQCCLHAETARDRNRLAGDVAAFIRRKEDTGMANFLRLPPAFEAEQLQRFFDPSRIELARSLRDLPYLMGPPRTSVM